MKRRKNKKAYRRISATRTSLKTIANKVRQEGTLEDCRLIISKILLSSEIGATLGNVRASTYENICPYATALEVSTPENQIKWSVALFLNRSGRINDIIESYKSIHSKFLKGDFTDVESLLNTHEQKFGVSLKSFQLRILINVKLQQTLQTDVIIEKLSKNKKNAIMAFLAEKLSIRINPRTSQRSYYSNIDNLIKDTDSDYYGIHDYIKIATTPYRDFPIRDIGKTLNIIQDHPLEDHYFFFLDTIRRYFSENNELPGESINYIAALSESINSLYLDNTLSVLINSKVADAPTISTLFYKKGEYAESARQAAEAIIQDPCNFQNYITLIKAIHYSKNEFSISGIIEELGNHSPTVQILKKIEVILKSDNAEDELREKLRDYTAHQPSLIIGHGVANFLIQFSPSAVTSWPEANARNPYVIETSEPLSASTPNTAENKLTGNHENSQDSALMYFISADYHSCLETLQGFEDESNFNYMLLIDKIKIFQLFIMASTEVGKLDGAIAQSIKALELGIPSQCLPLQYVLDKSQRLRFNDANTYASLALLRSITGASPQEINAAVEGLLNKLELSLPSELCSINGDRLTDEVLINCCSASVLEWNIEIETPDAIATERISICTHLISKKDLNLSESQKASLERDQQHFTEYLFRRQAVQQLATTRIYVPKDAVSDLCHKEQHEDIESMLALRHLNIRFVDLKVLLESGELEDTKPTNWGGTKYLSIFRRILHIFCWNKHFGLDGHLSMTIRHGTLLGQIRTPFQQSMLVTDEKSDGSGYMPNTELEKALRLTAKQQSQIDEASEQLSKEIDSIHKNLRSRLIQIRTEEANKEGLFDFRFSDVDIDKIWNEQVVHTQKPVEVINNTIQTLIKRLDENLIIIRNYFEENVLSELLEVLRKFEDDAQEYLTDDEQRGMFQSRIADCRTKLQIYMKQASSWFSSQQIEELPSISLTMLLRFAIAQAEGLTGKKLKEAEILEPNEATIKGSYFNAVYHIIQILILNAIKHSALPSNETTLHLGYSYNKTTHVCTIYCENNLSPQLDISGRTSRIRKMIIAAKEGADPQLVAKEGGSGFAKIFRNLESNFSSESDLMIEIIGENKIRLSVSFKIELLNQ